MRVVIWVLDFFEGYAMPIRWGVIGAGGFADRVAIPGLLAAKGNALQAVMVRDQERAESLARKYGVSEAYDSIESLVRSETIDAVYVCSPLHLHEAHTTAAANAGKHILCEKPMALDVSSCDRMIEACRATDVKLMIGFMLRFHPHHRRIREMIQEGTLGQIVEARTQRSFWYPSQPDNWRQDPARGLAGGLADVGSHAIDLLRFLLGEIVEVSAMTDTLVHEYAVEDLAVVLLRFASRAIGIADTSFAIPRSRALLEIYGTEGTIFAERVQGHELCVRCSLRDGSDEEINLPAPNLYTEEFEHFATCISEDREPSITGRDGQVNIEILRAVLESAEKGTYVRLVHHGGSLSPYTPNGHPLEMNAAYRVVNPTLSRPYGEEM